MELGRPRQWGGCWLACELYHQLELDQFFSQRLAANRKGTRWDLILQTLVCYRLLDPAASGVCIGSGSCVARWLICWPAIFAGPKP